MTALTLDTPEPPMALPVPLQALWWDARGDWARAHDFVNEEPGRDAAWVHAYLHRKEGDAGNASYWYARAGRPVATGSFDIEWRTIVSGLGATA